MNTIIASASKRRALHKRMRGIKKGLKQVRLESGDEIATYIYEPIMLPVKTPGLQYT